MKIEAIAGVTSNTEGETLTQQTEARYNREEQVYSPISTPIVTKVPRTATM